MSKFNTLMENHLSKTDLLRIRIKYDPANKLGEMRDYVGYVLEEDGAGNVIAIVPSIGSDPMSFGPDQYDMEPGCGQMEPEQGPDPLGGFKKHVVKYLMSRGYHDKVTEHMDLILNAKHVTDLEKLLQSCGCDGTGVLNMYRDFVNDGTVR